MKNYKKGLFVLVLAVLYALSGYSQTKSVTQRADDLFKQKKYIEAVKLLIMNEVNVKELKFVEGQGVLVKKVKCNFRTMGKKFGKLMKGVAAAMDQLSQEQIAELEQQGRDYAIAIRTAHMMRELGLREETVRHTIIKLVPERFTEKNLAALTAGMNAVS